MTEQLPGLRFDIYERVHLQEGVTSIQELNDVELVPHIQVVTDGDQAVLQGNLLLTGSYVGDHGAEARTLEHLIPVEITLPLNRIHRVEDILVEIENFDVDLLSSRSLNVTGVLSLQGVEMISSAAQAWNEDEEMTFVHEKSEARSEPIKESQLVNEQPLVNEPPLAMKPTVETISTEHPEAEALESDGNFELTTEVTEIKSFPDPIEGTVVTEEKKEVKLAFGKKAAEAVELKPYGIKSLLSKAGAAFQSDKRKEDATSVDEPKVDAVEWKRLFLQSNAEGQQFRKVRMCIVQKEETLETIAKRYQLNPRELQLLNRLTEPDITAGQVIYLPK